METLRTKMEIYVQCLTVAVSCYHEGGATALTILPV